jgi:GNAT superfamily N-acetyltransferase
MPDTGLAPTGFNDTMRIREAKLEDAETVSEIVCLCYQGFGDTGDYPNEVIIELKRSRGSATCIRELIADEGVFVADDKGRIKGVVSVKDNEITKLFVHPNYQRRGIGKQLFAHAESFIRDHGHQDLFLGAAVRTALPFYERMGMRITRERTIDRGPCLGMTSIVLEKRLGAEQGAPADADRPPR